MINEINATDATEKKDGISRNSDIMYISSTPIPDTPITPNPIKSKLLINNKYYIDISTIGLLKLLYRKHKICKAVYKDSLIRLKRGRRLKNTVYTKCMYYLKTIRCSTRKNTLLAMGRRESKEYKQFLVLSAVNGQSYSTYLKKKAFNRVFDVNLVGAYQNLLVNKITNELNNKLLEGREKEN